MNALILALAPIVTCYNYGTVTQCSDGTIVYRYGNQMQIDTINQQPSRQLESQLPATPAIEPIQPFDSGLRVLEPFK